MTSKTVLDKTKLNNYKLKITALSPIHIGTGDVYEPTNFVIDKNTFYAFDEVLFYQSLNPLEKQSLNMKLGDWIQIINFYKDHIGTAKQIASFECEVSDKVYERYSVRRNKDGKQNYNQLHINTTFKNPNTFRAVIPGSSIKGMMNTVFQIYPRKINENSVRQKLLVSDAQLLNGGVEVGYSYRSHKNPTKEARSDIPQMVEVIKKGSSFICDLSSEHSFTEIQESMKRYHEERQDSQFKQTENSFIARIGKYSGKEYMVDDGKNVLNSYDKPIATHTIYEKGNSPFGWIKIERLSYENYSSYLEEIKMQERDYFLSLEEKQSSVRNQILKVKKEVKEVERKKEEARIAEEKAKAKEKVKREAELAAMDPLDKLIDSYDNEPAQVINAMQNSEIENIEIIQRRLAQKLQKIMQKDPKQWDKAKKKALKRKEYIESILHG